MRARARTDANQQAIVRALRRIGCQVADLSRVGSGVPDLLCGYHGINILLEVKDGDKTPGNRPLTKDQKNWHARWPGQVAVVTTAEEAQAMVIQLAVR
jgi:hypothetical protein